MKILQIITHLELGGAQKATFNLFSWLKSRNYQVSLLSSREGILYPEFREQLNTSFKELRFLRREINIFFDLIAFFSLFIFIKENKFDIVHTHTSKAGIIGRWAAFFCFKPKVVHTVHGFAFHEHQNPIPKHLYIFLERLTARITDKIIAVSEEVRDKGLRYKIGQLSQYAVVYELVDIKGKKIAVQNKQRFKVGMIAALKPQKAPQDFVKAAFILSQKRKDLEFILVGDGRLRPEIEKLVQRFRLSGNFKILGWRKDVEQILPQLDVLVLSSIFEGQPHIVIEGLAYGLAMVATRVDGVKDLIRDGKNGLLVEPRKPREIALAVEKLLDDQELREKISFSAYEYFCQEKKLDYFSNLAKIESIYKEIGNETV